MKFRIIPVAILLLLSAGAAFGQDAAGLDIDGKWTGKYSTGFGDPMNMEFTFKAEGNVLKGTTIGGANGEQIPLLDGKIEGNKISFTVMVDMMGQAMKFSYTGEISGEKIKLKFNTGGGMGGDGSFTVSRPKEKVKKEKVQKEKKSK